MARHGPLGMYTLYSLLTAAGMVLLSPYFLIRGLARGKYLDNIPERFGWKFPPELRAAKSGVTREKSIWIHAVSVGEMLAAVPLARQLKQRYPQRRLVVSTTTATGQKLARDAPALSSPGENRIWRPQIASARAPASGR